MKKYFLVLVGMFFLMGCEEERVRGVGDGSDASSSYSYNVGDITPNGGIIFITPDTPGNTTGMYFEAAAADLPETYRWSGATQEVGISDDEYYKIGKGHENTLAIIGSQDGDLGEAPELCYGYDSSREWFVPSLDELMLMYENLHKKGLGSFENTSYWSSTERNEHDGRRVRFHAVQEGGEPVSTNGKWNKYKIRCVKSFR